MNAHPSPGRRGAVDAAADGSPTLRMRLRNETRPAHETLDAHFERLGLDGSEADYARFLRMNETCLRVLEPALETSGVFEALLGITPRRRSPAARADLGALNLRPMVPPPFGLPRPDLAQAIGIAYVLEGSRLGARQILKRFDKRRELDNGGAIPTSFLESAGDAEQFRSFLDAAEAAVATEGDRNRAVEAANCTFDFFIGTVLLADSAPCSGE